MCINNIGKEYANMARGSYFWIVHGPAVVLFFPCFIIFFKIPIISMFFPVDEFKAYDLTYYNLPLQTPLYSFI